MPIKKELESFSMKNLLSFVIYATVVVTNEELPPTPLREAHRRSPTGFRFASNFGYFP